ncbi:expressed unknown protein [Seminavis robusta]|uniref:Uncharacterized protein n=1 Tax=Seminavis robusta TaxID=568900 RepID=A0A9N8DDN9_9STRA|nr:expressed unknown protein [Seminavis robusta]|eukprot:Sro46_g027600.1 n/a (919) ;mRNA; r:147439-150315
MKKKRGVRRSVSFNEAGPTIQRIDSVRCLLLLAADNDNSNTDNEEEMEANFLNEIWYDKMEIASQKEENAELVLELDNKNNGDDDTNNNKEEPHDATLRGLERQTEEGSWQAFQNRNKALEAVLDTKPQNDEELASLSSQATQDAKRVAQQRALQDEKEAQEYLQDVRTSILNGSIHSMLSMGTAEGGGSAHSMPLLSMEDLHDNDDTDDDDDDATFASESDGEASLGFEDTAVADNKPTKKQGKTKVKKKVQRVKSLPSPNIPALGDAHHDDDDEEDSILSPFASGAKKLRDARKRLSAETPNKKKKAMELGHKSDTALMDDDSSSSNSDNTPQPTSFSSLKNKTTTMRRAKSLGTATSTKEKDCLATTKKKKTATKKTKTTASKTTTTTTTNSDASPLTRLQRCKSAPMPKAPTPAEEIAALLSDVSNTSENEQQGPMMDDDSSRTSIRIRVSKMNQNPTPPPFDFSKKKTTTRTKAQQSSQRASLPATALYQWKDHFPKGSTTTNSNSSDSDEEDPKMSVSASAADYQWQEHSEEQRDDNTAKQVSSSSSAKSLQLLQQEQAKLNAKKAKMEAYAKKHHDDDDNNNNNNNNKEEEPPPKRVLPMDNFNIDPSMLPRRKNKKSPGLKRSNTLEGDKPKQQRAGTLDRPKAPRRTKSAASKKAMLGGEMPLRSKSQGKKGGLSGGLAKFVMKTQQIEQKREATQVTKQPEDSSDDDDDEEENVPKNKLGTAKKDVALPKKLEKQQETEAKQPAVLDAGGGESDDDDESDCDSPDEDAPTRRSTFTGSLACIVTGDYAAAENDKKEEPQQRASTGSIPKTKKAESTTEENTAPKSRAVPARSKSASKKAMLLPSNGSRTGGRKLPERSSSMGNPASAKRNKFPSNGKRASVQRIPRRKGAATGSEDSEPLSRASSSVN